MPKMCGCKSSTEKGAFSSMSLCIYKERRLKTNTLTLHQNQNQKKNQPQYGKNKKVMNTGTYISKVENRKQPTGRKRSQ